MLTLRARGRRAGDHDVGLAVFLLLYGFATFYNPAGWTDKPVYDFLDGADLRCVSGWIIMLGLMQAAGAAFNLRYWRKSVAILALWHWAAFAWGAHQYDANAYIPFMYAGASIGNAIVAWRV